MPTELIKPILTKIINPSKLEIVLKTISSKQIKPIQLDFLDLNNIYRIIFKLNSKKKYLVSYKFTKGLISIFENSIINNNFVNNLTSFINSFINYIEKNNLTNIIGLQFLGAIKNNNQHMPFITEFKLGEKGIIILLIFILKNVELVPTSQPNITWSSTSKPTNTNSPIG